MGSALLPDPEDYQDLDGYNQGPYVPVSEGPIMNGLNTVLDTTYDLATQAVGGALFGFASVADYPIRLLTRSKFSPFTMVATKIAETTAAVTTHLAHPDKDNDYSYSDYVPDDPYADVEYDDNNEPDYDDDGEIAFKERHEYSEEKAPLDDIVATNTEPTAAELRENVYSNSEDKERVILSDMSGDIAPSITTGQKQMAGPGDNGNFVARCSKRKHKPSTRASNPKQTKFLKL